MATLIIGGNRLALTMAKLLSTSGEKVCLLGGGQAARGKIGEMMLSDVEKDVPFQFVDDLKLQQDLLNKRLNKIRICNRLAEVGCDLKAVVTTGEMHVADFAALGSVPVASLDGLARRRNHIAIRLYEPVEAMKMARILISPSTDVDSLSCIRGLLEDAGITEITSEQADTANALLAEDSTSNLNDVIWSILPSRKPVDHTHFIMH